MKTVEIKINEFVFDGYECGPANAPLVLFLHGFPQFADSWSKILPLVGDAGFRAVALNQRGYSQRANPSRVADYKSEFLIDDTAAFAIQLGAKRFHLVGHDWGGAVGWEFAAQYPDRLLSLNIISTPHLDAFRESLRLTIDQPLKSSYMALFRAPFHLAERVITARNWQLLRKSYLGYVSDAQIEKNTARLAEGNRLTSALNWYRASRLSRRLGEITVPTLYIWGSKDQALGEKAALKTETFIRAPYRFERIEGGSHWLPDQHPRFLAECLLENIKRYN